MLNKTAAAAPAPAAATAGSTPNHLWLAAAAGSVTTVGGAAGGGGADTAGSATGGVTVSTAGAASLPPARAHHSSIFGDTFAGSCTARSSFNPNLNASIARAASAD